MSRIPLFAKEWREYRGMSLAEAARKMGLLVSELSALESREEYFDENDLERLAETYDVNPALLISLNPEELKGREPAPKAAPANDEGVDQSQ